MKLHTLDTGFFKLDGGAMFGIVPKGIWKKLNPPDENNLCTWAMRCLLIEEGDRLVLIDCGIGDKQDEKFFSYFEPHGDDSLIKSLKNKGFGPDDVTDVVLTHLHFDHCGGAVIRSKDGSLNPQFPNATYWSNKDHWQWALNPNPREKASFLKENILPIQESGQLKFIDKNSHDVPGLSFDLSFCHTEAMIIPRIHYKDKVIIYGADLMPSSFHIPMPYIMAYDIRPMVTLEEKGRLLGNALENDHILYFEHDPVIECCSLKQTDRGIRLDQAMKLSEIL